MSGEWIKMRTNLWDDPRVCRVCDLTDQCEAAIVGGLYWLWTAADEHTEDGFLEGMTERAIDRKTGVKGLAASLAAIGWIEVHEHGIQVVRFDEHNGVSAKKRALDAQRKAKSRTHKGQKTGGVHKVSASEADKDRTGAGQDADSVRTKTGHLPELELEEDIYPPVVPPADAGGDATKRKGQSQGSRLPDDWELPAEWRQWCRENHPGVDPDWEEAKFRDYWHAQSGAKARKADWRATWRNWVRNAAEGGPGRRRPGPVAVARDPFAGVL